MPLRRGGALTDVHAIAVRMAFSHWKTKKKLTIPIDLPNLHGNTGTNGEHRGNS